jgi:hypothetical protein
MNNQQNCNERREETLEFETQILKDRLTLLYRHVEQRLINEKYTIS